jgi:hypothetical protein
MTRAAGFRGKTPEAKVMAGVAGDAFDRLTQLLSATRWRAASKQ